MIFPGILTMLSDVDEIPVIQLGDLTLRFELEDLDDIGIEVAERELRETPERKAAAIEELRALLKGNLPHLTQRNGWPCKVVEVVMTLFINGR